MRHVVWDWNGTLFHDNDAVVVAVNAVLTSLGGAPITLAQWREVYGRPLKPCYERLLGRPISVAEWATTDGMYHDAYRPLLPTCLLAPGVPDLLRDWQASGRTQSLLSMWHHHELVPYIAGLGLTDLFVRVDGLVGVGGGSKATHLARHLAALDADPAQTVVIGDVVDDAEAAAHVGARCVLVTTGPMTRAALEATGAPVVDSLAEALDRLDTDRAA